MCVGSAVYPSAERENVDQYVLNHEDAQPDLSGMSASGIRVMTQEADRSPGWISATERCPVCEKCPEPPPLVLDGVEPPPPEPTCEELTALQPSSCAKKCNNEKKCKKFASTKCGACPATCGVSPCPKVCRDEWKKCAAKCTSDSKCGKTGKKTKLSKK